MEVGLQAGFGDTIAPLDVLESLGIQWVRCDMTDATDLPGIVRKFHDSSCKPLFLIRDIAVNERLLDAALPTLGSDFAIEVFNEPNYNGISLETFTKGVKAVRNDCRERGFTGHIISGAIGNLNKDGIAYLTEAVKRFNSDIVVGFHRYQPGTQIGLFNQNRRDVPWKPFKSRKAELDHLHKLAGPRKIAYTEFGYHTAGERVFFKNVRMTNEQVRANLIEDFKLYDENDVLMSIVYQWTDGPNDMFLDRFGIVDLNGNLKPQAEAFKAWLDRS